MILFGSSFLKNNSIKASPVSFLPPNSPETRTILEITSIIKSINDWMESSGILTVFLTATGDIYPALARLMSGLAWEEI